MELKNKAHYEYLRIQAKDKFNQVRGTWIDCGRWAYPHRIKWLLSQTPGERNNQHIVDSTHILALRSFVAGFLEGNTSASRPWFRIFSKDDDLNEKPENKAWLQHFTDRCLHNFISSNFYHSAGQFYYDYGVFNTGAQYIDEIRGRLYYHNLVPGSYYVINNTFGEAIVLVREWSMTVKALVDRYGKKKNGIYDWSNFSDRVKNLYLNGNYQQMIDIVQVVHENDQYDITKPMVLLNKRWLSCTYELGGVNGQYYQDGQEFGFSAVDVEKDKAVYLEVSARKRKPFIIGKSPSNSNYEYGEEGPTLYALGLIKSLNKKAISKDQAIEGMLRPPVQGPANLKKSYITTAPNSYIPLDAQSIAAKAKLSSIFDINPQIAALLEDQTDLRGMVEKLYFADYLMYLSRNPKTRTATETNAVVQEQQLIIGPNLQSLNWTYNTPQVEYNMDFTLFEDPFLKPPPPDLAGQFLQPEFISIFAQAQKAADLPAIERFIGMAEQIGQIPQGAKIWDKVNLDKLADLYDDRLFLPAGLVNDQGKVDAMREQAARLQARQTALQETLPAVAGAAKDLKNINDMKQAQSQAQ